MDNSNSLNSLKETFLKWTMLLMLFVLLTSWQSDAQEPADSAMVKRIQFLQKSLQNDQDGTKQWWYGWLGFYSAATIGQGIVYFSYGDKNVRQDMALGAATTLLGVTGQFISPFQPVSFAGRFEMLPEGSTAERQAKLTQMEKFLADRSLMEGEARKWRVHILPTSVNMVSGVITWLGFHRTFLDGVVNFGLNCVLTETQIWTQPIRAKRALRRYQAEFGRQDISILPHHEINFKFMASANGAGVRVVF